jgi:hypothetical protein
MDKQLRQSLFEYFAQEHGVTLLDSDFNEISQLLDRYKYCRCGSKCLVNTTGKEVRCRICKKKLKP